jgi:hypothetical protein
MYADGDPIGELPVRVSAVRGAVTVLVPADAAGESSAFSPPPTLAIPAVPTTPADGDEPAPIAESSKPPAGG